ncbi:DUF6355 family natural product biosynthesis protein [Kitasatospora sp. LaBMicrA B282]|uniref:DUF6355 family natural product biosynthesis protein n=1 Tax=Kitasatospora sp. LaBMicrA B282 TaxID=3420949 RepID=UPI003D0B6F4B
MIVDRVWTLPSEPGNVVAHSPHRRYSADRGWAWQPLPWPAPWPSRRSPLRRPPPSRPGQAAAGTSRDGERAYYEHCATNTDVWIQVTRFPRSDYHRCVGPGRTNLDLDATGAWYDSTYQGGLCSHPGDTGP